MPGQNRSVDLLARRKASYHNGAAHIQWPGTGILQVGLQKIGLEHKLDLMMDSILTLYGVHTTIQSLLLMIVLQQTPMLLTSCLLYTSPSPRDRQKSRMPS